MRYYIIIKFMKLYNINKKIELKIKKGMYND